MRTFVVFLFASAVQALQLQCQQVASGSTIMKQYNPQPRFAEAVPSTQTFWTWFDYTLQKTNQIVQLEINVMGHYNYSFSTWWYNTIVRSYTSSRVGANFLTGGLLPTSNQTGFCDLSTLTTTPYTPFVQFMSLPNIYGCIWTITTDGSLIITFSATNDNYVPFTTTNKFSVVYFANLKASISYVSQSSTMAVKNNNDDLLPITA